MPFSRVTALKADEYNTFIVCRKGLLRLKQNFTHISTNTLFTQVQQLCLCSFSIAEFSLVNAIGWFIKQEALVLLCIFSIYRSPFCTFKLSVSTCWEDYLRHQTLQTWFFSSNVYSLILEQFQTKYKPESLLSWNAFVFPGQSLPSGESPSSLHVYMSAVVYNQS